MRDGRLLVPAASSWLAAVVVTVLLRSVVDLSARHQLGLRILVGSATGLLVVVLLGTMVAARRSEARVLVVVALAGLLTGAAAAAGHAAALAPQPLTEWVQSRATSTVQGVVTSGAIVKAVPAGSGWHGAPRREMRLSTSRIGARGGLIDVELPVVVRLADQGPSPPVGAELVIVGRLAPATPQSDAAAVLTVNAQAPQIAVVAGPGPVDAVAGAMRAGLRRALSGTAPDAGSLVAGLAIGDESGQSATLRLQMRSSGLAHLTAVSGGNVSIVVVAVLALAALLRLPVLARVLVSLLALAFFVTLVGPAPSVIRAAVMAGLVLIGLLVGGRRAGPSVLAAAVIVLVVLAPGLTTSWGFALSAGATAGVILLSSRTDRLLRRWSLTARLPPAIRDGLGITLAAQAATVPVLVAMGSTVGWVSLPANVLAMPVVAPVTILGLLAAVVAPVAPAVAGGLAHLAAWPAGWIALVAATCSDLPGARLPLPAGWPGVLALAGLVVGLVALGRVTHFAYPHGVPSTVRIAAAGVCALVVIGGVVLPPGRRSWPPAGWLMIMCDVGQGDALLLRARDQTAVVVDTGPEPEVVHRCLDDARVTAVAAVVLTHFHADHVGGIEGVLRDRTVGAVLATPIRDPPAEAARVEQLAADQGLAVEPISAGDARVVGGVSWRAVWPRRVIAAGSVPNNASLVLVVEIDGRRLLLMGDAEPEAQAAAAADITGLRYDVVKVPHHGSRYQHPLLTTWVPAPIALISVGAGNDYGHPAESTVAAWRGIGAIVVRTDISGDTAVVANGSQTAVVARHGMLPSS